MTINSTDIDLSRATVLELAELVHALQNKFGIASTASPNPDETDEERQALVRAIAEANVAAARVLDSMDRSHEILQEYISDVRQTREMLVRAPAAHQERSSTTMQIRMTHLTPGQMVRQYTGDESSVA
jgi:ABC-type transporter Mla subunit MlaD